MRRLIGSGVLVTILATLPTLVGAQRRAAATEAGPEHEFGVDLAFQYVSLGSGGGSGVRLAAPFDVRIGFLSKSEVMFEGRLTFDWDSNFGTVIFAPGVNALYQLKKGSGTHGLMRAPYLTGGIGLNITRLGPAPGSSATQFVIGGGVGKRLPYGSAVVRPEGFISYTFSSGTFPSAFAIGTRIGLSFWH